MNLNDLTIGAARELAALLPGLFGGSAAAPVAPVASASGTPVLIRDNRAGLIVGVLAADYRIGDSGWALRAGARKIHYWAKAAGPEGAALFGPGAGSRVCPPTPGVRAGNDAVEVIEITPDELAAIAAYPVWRP